MVLWSQGTVITLPTEDTPGEIILTAVGVTDAGFRDKHDVEPGDTLWLFLEHTPYYLEAGNEVEFKIQYKRHPEQEYFHVDHVGLIGI